MPLYRNGLGLGLTKYLMPIRKPPTGGIVPANYYAVDTNDFNNKLSLATSGQIIELTASGTFGDLTINKSNITVRGESNTSANVNRVIVTNAQNVTLQKLPIQWTGSGTDPLISLNGDINGLIIEDCKIRAGWGTPKLDFDPTFYSGASPIYPVGPVGGSTSGNGIGGNPAMTGSNGQSTPAVARGLPQGIAQGAGAIITGSYIIRRNILQDLSTGIRASANGTNISIDIYGNYAYRTYGIAMSITTGSTFVSSTKLAIRGNHAEDMWCQAQDNGNPHAEAFGFFPIDCQGPGPTPLNGVIAVGNTCWIGPNSRFNGTASFFFDDGNDKLYYQAPIVERNWLIARMAGGLAGNDMVGGVFRRNTVLAQTENNTARAGDNESTNNPFYSTNIPAASVLFQSVSFAENTSLIPNIPNLTKDNICEVATVTASGVKQGNIEAGFKASTSQRYDAIFNTPAAGWPTTMATLTAASAHLQGKASQSNAGKGALDEGQTPASLRAIWSADTAPYETIKPWVQWKDISLQPVSSTVYSSWAPITLAPGRTTTFSVSGASGGLEIADTASGSGATVAASSGSIAAGKWVRIKATSGALGSTETPVTITIDGTEVITWKFTTASTASFPVVNFSAARPDSYRATTTLGTNGQQGTLFLAKFKHSANNPAITEEFFSSTGTPKVRLQVLATGVLRLLLESSTGQVCRLETAGDVCDGNAHDIIFAWDTSQTTNTLGATVYVDGNSSTNTGAQWTSGMTVNYGLSNTYVLGGAGTSLALTFTAAITNATSATLTSAFTGTTGTWSLYFSDGSVRSVTLTNGSTAVSWTTAVASATTSAFANRSTNSNGNFHGQLGALWLDTTTRVDVAANLTKFTADQIGTNGSGVTGSQPRVFISGNASEYASGAASKGTSATFLPNGASAVTNVVTSNVANVSIPVIEGSAIDGTNVTLDLGLWSGDIDHFDIQVVDETSAVVLARQSVTQDTALTLNSVVGKTLTLKVWGIGTDSTETLATSAPFGPVAAAGDLLILAAAIQSSTLTPTLPSSPVSWTPMVITTSYADYPSTTANPNEAAINSTLGTAYNLDAGYGGSNMAGTPSANSAAVDDRRKGRDGGNGTMSTRSLIVTVPGPGYYRVYAGIGASNISAARNLCIRQGSATGSILLNFSVASQVQTSITDATGATHANVTDWKAASAANGVECGNAATILVTGTPGVAQTLYIGRSSDVTLATFLNCIAIFRKGLQEP